MIDEATINKAVDLLRQEAPGSTVIVFGFCARGQITEDNDFDVLKSTPKPSKADTLAAMARCYLKGR